MTTSSVENTSSLGPAYEALTRRYEAERQELSEAQLASWDAHPLRMVGFALVSTVWLSLGGQTVLPLGWLIAMLALVPQVSGWSLARRVRVTSWRSVVLLGAALVGLLLVEARVNLLGPAMISAGVRLSLPWLP